MRRRTSIRGCVRPSGRPSVLRRSVTPSLRRLLGASYAEYSALLWKVRVEPLYSALREKLEMHQSC